MFRSSRSVNSSVRRILVRGFAVEAGPFSGTMGFVPTVIVRRALSSRPDASSRLRGNGFSRTQWATVRSITDQALVESTVPKNKKAARKADDDESTSVSEEYGADKITVLEGLEPVRKRPGMYIGSTGVKGFHHLVFEVVDNSVDEALAGHSDTIDVTIKLDGYIEVSDNGRGIPTAKVDKTGKSALETVLTVLHAGGKFGDGGYKVSGGLHGVGLSVVNALSDDVEVSVWRDQKRHWMSFTCGKPRGELEEEFDDSRGSGTSVRFHPDPKIFLGDLKFNWDILASRLRELSYLNAGLKITLTDERVSSSDEKTSQTDEQDDTLETAETEEGKADVENAKRVEFVHEGGIKEYMTLLCKDKTPLHSEQIYFDFRKNGFAAELVLQWCGDSYTESLFGFVNNIKTIDGGTHLDGLKFAVTKAVNTAAKANNKLKGNIKSLSGEFVREGLTAILSVKVPDPEFEGQTKTKLGNPEVREFIRTCVEEELSEFFSLNNQVLNDIIEKASQAYNASAAAKSARDLIRRKTVLESTTLPGKLADCASRNAEEAEIFVVEGDSAGGSAKQARDRHSQAILPIRGKIINIERTDDARIYANSEVQALITACGLGFKGEEFEGKKLRYHKIIIMTDADVDGAHIRTLLLTLFYRYQKELINQGYIYIACPPLYKLEYGQKMQYAYSDAELERKMKELGNKNYRVQRFKGLGEMMAKELWDTTMNPETRILKQVTSEDAIEADGILSLLMGDNTDNRREFIQAHADKFDLNELDY